MKLVFYSIILNNHQANVADELWELTNHSYCFVELVKPNDDNKKGSMDNYGNRPYLLRAWESTENYYKAMELAMTVECCVFSGLPALPFEKARMKKGLLSFDMSERWLKKGWKNLFSPTILRMFLTYHFGGWKHKHVYKLCCSGFAAEDQRKLLTFKNKCYKWGYFTRVDDFDIESPLYTSSSGTFTKLMWCARFLILKHPELPVMMAHRLRENGYNFRLDMYGDGEFKSRTIELAKKLGVDDVVRFIGNKPNEELMADMRQHEIFLFTSDRNEGWGAVANESMANGCVLVSSDNIGSTPYLVENGKTGFSFHSPAVSSNFDNPDIIALDDLCHKVEWLLNHNEERKEMRLNAHRLMIGAYSPRTAAERLLSLIDNLSNGRDTEYIDGPCSKA